jgi:hypothetical protein
MATIDEPVSLPKSGRCKRCGRQLSDHTSILFEMGPVCRAKEGMKITKPRVHKVDLTIKKPKVHTFKFKKVEGTAPTFDFEDWFSNKEEKEQ